MRAMWNNGLPVTLSVSCSLVTLGIDIRDKVAQRILTPAALIDFVAANVPVKPTEECLSHRNGPHRLRGRVF
jgi:hypothetical protein